MVSVFLFDAPFITKPRGIDLAGLVMMVVGFGFLQLCLDLGEKNDWFDSGLILGLLMLAVCALVAFVIRELLAQEPILDLSVFNDRNFAVGTMCIALVALGFNSSVLLVALYTQKILAWDAWNAGLVLAPGGLGTMIALLISGRLVARADQRLMLAGGCLLQAMATTMMASVTLGMDYWSLAWPRFLQGFAGGFIFPPLQTLTLATVRLERLGNATAAYNVVRNIGGSIGVALATTLLVRRSQEHQTTLVAHLNVWDTETVARLKQWTEHFVSQGSDSYTAGRRALAMLYRGTVHGDERGPCRNQAPRRGDLLESTERVAGAVGEERGRLEAREVRRPELGRATRRMKRVREQQQRIGEPGLARQQHARLAASVRLPAEEDPAGHELSHRRHRAAQSLAVSGRTSRPRRSC